MRAEELDEALPLDSRLRMNIRDPFGSLQRERHPVLDDLYSGLA